MSRDVPFEENILCESCGKTGAYDFMGDFLCMECAFPAAAGKTEKEE